MNELNKNEIEGLLKGMVGEFINAQLTQRKDTNDEGNNSFVYFEKSTLNILLKYLLSGEKLSSLETKSDDYGGNILASLNQIIDQNKLDFEEIISKLRKIS